MDKPAVLRGQNMQQLILTIPWVARVSGRIRQADCLTPALDHNPKILLGTSSCGFREGFHLPSVILSWVGVAREAPNFVEYPVFSELNKYPSVVIYTSDCDSYVFFSKNKAVRAFSYPMSPPSITISDCPSGSINKRNLVSFHDRSNWINSVINRIQFTIPEARLQWLGWACFSNTAEAHNNIPPWVSSQDSREKYPQIGRFMGRPGLDTLHSQPEGQRPPAALLARPAERKRIFLPPGPSRSAQSGASSS